MEKKKTILLAIWSFTAGMFFGLIISNRMGKLVINGDNNVIRTGYKSYNGNHNGSPNSSCNGANKDK